MNLNGLNIKKLREINKVRIIAKKKGVNIFSESFCTTQPVGSFQTQINTSSVPKSVAKFLSGSFIGSLLTSSLTTAIGQAGGFNGYSTAMNYPYKYSFTGTNTFQKTIQCFLQVENDFYDDIIKPLWNLLNFLLPKESEGMGSALKVRDVKTASDANPQSTAGQFLKSGYELGNVAWDVFLKYADDPDNPITFFKIPEQLDLDTNITICIGEYIKIENVIISGITLDIPSILLYENGLFDRVNITLQLTGTRDMNLESYNWIGKLHNEFTKRQATTKAFGETLQSKLGILPQTINNNLKNSTKGVKIEGIDSVPISQDDYS